ncbi:MAG: hypothetical protein L0I62_05160, partial [Gammaproteobacteria bacterium]|nr:hypothetical protein [Gammaproteobacteria bacterium]
MKKALKIIPVVAGALLAAAVTVSCTPVAGGDLYGPSSMDGSHKPSRHADVMETISKFRKGHENLADFFRTSYAYAVFPSIGSGAQVMGGAYGEGEVYRNGKLLGYATVTELDIAPQAGAGTFRELVFFEDRKTFHRFAKGDFRLDADMPAEAVKTGVPVTNDFIEGVAVFTMSIDGSMAEASVGGQQFTYTSVEQIQEDHAQHGHQVDR